jgi:hypothetical protein
MPYGLRIRFEQSLRQLSLTAAYGAFRNNGQTATLRATFNPVSGLPTWVPALNTLATINQNVLTAVDPCPAAICPYEGEGDYTRMLTAWNSGFWASDYEQLGAFGVCGGGDADYWANHVTVFPLSTRQWVRVNSPSLAASVANETYVRSNAYGEWPDGTPAMPHTYGNIAYMPSSMGGGTYGSVVLPWKSFYMRQSSTGHGHKCDLATGTWSRATSTAGAGSEACFALDSTRNRFVGVLTGSGNAYQTTLRVLGSFSSGTAAHTTVGPAHWGLGNYAACDYAPGLDALLVVGSDLLWTQKLRGYDMASATGAYYDLTITGDALPTTGGLGLAWAEDANALYLLSTGSADKQYLWKCSPPAGDWRTGAWTVTRITMTGATVTDTPTANGMWQRLRYAESIKSLVWVHSVGGPVYCYRVANPTATITLQTTTTAVTHPNASAVVSPSSKHLCFSYSSGRWWKMTGDHRRDDVESDDSYDGRQEIYSFTVLANDWRRDQRYYIYDPAQVQQFQPDDAFSVAMPNNEIWVYRSTGVLTRPAVPPEGATAPTAEQVYDHIMAYNTQTLRWRKVRAIQNAGTSDNHDEWLYGRSWRGTYDAKRDRVLIPLEYNGLKVFEMRGSDGADISPRVPSTGRLYGRNCPYAYHWTIDPDTDYAYAMDWRYGNFYRINLLDFNQITNLGIFPNEAFRVIGPSILTRGVRQCWHPGLRAVIVMGYAWNVYEVDTGTLTQIPRADYFIGSDNTTQIYTSDVFYDGDSGFVVSIGGIDWGGKIAPAVYYKQAFTRG